MRVLLFQLAVLDIPAQQLGRPPQLPTDTTEE